MEAVLIWVIVAATVGGGMQFLQRHGRRLAVPVATLTLAAVTTAVSVAGILSPAVLNALGRDRSRLVDGQWWRIVTPLVVQDGAWGGLVFNVVVLLVVGTVAESIVGARTTVFVYLVSGVASEVVAYTLIPHQGFAGNSVADLGLAGLCLAMYVLARRGPAVVFGVVGLLAGLVLLVTGNLHGVGFTAGALCGAGIVWWRSRLSPVTSE
ncbi:MAG: rhomboid family intramembrane serine protease [Gordonia sp. (in: high G+C Gram-positive bacteria)]|uniref:rhomboid family intramembrane serine protease n=1 Tax=Gordonia sp. (in: high G+C Gram-positive bacteria) TaxID=84139 RepID=UPI0039E71CE8